MGSDQFGYFASASRYEDPEDAFNSIRDRAAWGHGNGGYTGTIAEKNGWEMRNDGKPIEHGNVKKFVYGDPSDEDDWGDIEENDKWGPAFCVPVSKDGEMVGWIFYGWASS